MVSPASSISRRSHHIATSHALRGRSMEPGRGRYCASSAAATSEMRTSGALFGGPNPRMHALTQSLTSRARVSFHGCPRRTCSIFASPRLDPTVLYLAAIRHAAPQRTLYGVSG